MKSTTVYAHTQIIAYMNCLHTLSASMYINYTCIIVVGTEL